MHQFHFRSAQPEDAGEIKAFNRRLSEAGETYHRLKIEPPFRTMAHLENSPITAERLFCFEGDEIRGGVNVKRMMFRINGCCEEVAYSVYPLSEGIINPKYSMIGLLIQKEFRERHPLSYSLGGSRKKREEFSRPAFALNVPLHFSVLRARPFLGNINYLRKNKWMRILLDIAAYSGAGAIGLQCFRLFQHLRRRRPDTKNLNIERFDTWGDWADQVWDSACNSYSLIGDRSKTALQSLYPDKHEHLIKLRFETADTRRVIGWAVVTVAKMRNHHYFNNMVLGAIVDMLAVPEDACAVISGALVVAREAKADVVIIEHTDQRWNEAAKQAGMLPAKSKDYLSLSPKLLERFNPAEDYAPQFYFTRGDGHGPTSLWMADYHSHLDSA